MVYVPLVIEKEVGGSSKTEFDFRKIMYRNSSNVSAVVLQSKTLTRYFSASLIGMSFKSEYSPKFFRSRMGSAFNALRLVPILLI